MKEGNNFDRPGRAVMAAPNDTRMYLKTLVKGMLGQSGT